MKSAILYFSGTGNTRWVAEYIYKGISNSGTVPELFDIAETSRNDFSEFDTVVIAHPVYGANIPAIVLERIPKMQFNGNAHLNVITTFGYVNALGPFREATELGMRLFSYLNIRMFNNITTPGINFKIMPLNKRLKHKKVIEKLLDKKITKIIRGTRVIEGIGPWLVPGGIIKRTAFIKLKNNYETFSIDPVKCTNCMKCVSGCPVKAISLYENHFNFNAACTACMRCYNNCPSAAILVNGIYADPAEYPRYRGPWI